MLSSHAEEFRAFARECLEMAEASHAGLRRGLIELFRQWMRAALCKVTRKSRTTIRAVRQTKLVSGPAMGAPDHDERAQIVKADEQYAARTGLRQGLPSIIDGLGLRPHPLCLHHHHY